MLSSRFRIGAVIACSVAAHVGVLAVAFVMRAKEPPEPTTEVVSVLIGHVDLPNGELHLGGMHDARIKR